MGEVRPIPTLGGVFGDARGQGRALRVSWHAEDGLVVLSLWDGGRCTGTVRVVAADVPALMEALGSGLHTLDPAPAQRGPAPAPHDPVAAPADEPAAPSAPTSARPASAPAEPTAAPAGQALAPVVELTPPPGPPEILENG